LEVLKDEKLLSSQWLDLSSGPAHDRDPHGEKSSVHEVTIGAALGERYDENASQNRHVPGESGFEM